MARIVIVEDEQKISEILSSYLEAEGFEVWVTESGTEGVEWARSDADLIILDLMLPDMSGEEVCKAIRRGSNVPIIMLTAKSSEEERIHGLGLGADDYVVKPFSPRELVLRVKAVLKRSQRESPPSGPDVDGSQSYNEGALVIRHAEHDVLVNGAVVSLTPVEFKALASLARNPGRVLSRAQLIDMVYGYSFEGYDRTVDAHIKNLRRKIEPDPRTPLFVQTVYGLGYRFSGTPDAD